jgi:hypothetical protein
MEFGSEQRTIQWWVVDNLPEKILGMYFWQNLVFGPQLTNYAAIDRGPSTRRLRLTGKVADATSGIGFECGLFL